MRLEGKVAVIVGAGQSPGEGIGNGRATTLRFAQEGARILAVDRLIASAEETAAAITELWLLSGKTVSVCRDGTYGNTMVNYRDTIVQYRPRACVSGVVFAGPSY